MQVHELFLIPDLLWNGKLFCIIYLYNPPGIAFATPNIGAKFLRLALLECDSFWRGDRVTGSPGPMVVIDRQHSQDIHKPFLCGKAG